MTWVVVFATTALIFICQWKQVYGHVGEPCNKLLGRCLPPSPHIYCDSENICRCEAKFPVAIGPHTCKSAKRIGERCSHLKECSHQDSNSHCTKHAYESQCACNDGYYYASLEDKCIEGSAPKRPPSYPKSGFLTSIIVFLLGCFAVLCCFVFAWHSFCKVSESSAWDARHTASLAQLPMSSRSLPSDLLNNNRVIRRDRHHISREGNVTSSRPFSTTSTAGILPSYDSAVYNQPPPSYEDAVKDMSIEATAVNLTVVTPEPVVTSSSPTNSSSHAAVQTTRSTNIISTTMTTMTSSSPIE